MTALSADGKRTINRTIKKGQPFWHLVVSRARRTHWLLKPTSARAAMRNAAGEVFTLHAYTWPYPPDTAPPAEQFYGWYPGYTTPHSDGGVLLWLSAEETAELPDGEYEADILADYANKSITDYPLWRGVIKVASYDSIAPRLEEDSLSISLQMTQFEDFTRYIKVPDEDDEALVIDNAYMVVKNGSDAVVFSAGWAAAPLDENDLSQLPSSERGYLCPPVSADFTLTMHISDQALIQAGVHRFWVYVRDAATTDWAMRLSGTLSVKQGAAPPA